MQEFDYVLADSVEEAVALLLGEGDGALILSGGTDLLVQLREGRRRASLLVDIKGIQELNRLSYDPVEGLKVGAAVPCYRICRHPDVVSRYPGLLDAVSLIGGVQIQGRASVGGNLCNASPAGDTIPALIVHGAICVIAGPGGRREVRVEDFCMGPGHTVLDKGELLVALCIPPHELAFGAHYLRFIPRNEMDIAVAGAGASVVLDATCASFQSVRIALGGVAPRPLFVREAGEALTRRKISDEAIEEAAQIARAAASPVNDLRGTRAQRRHLSAVLVRRALKTAIGRARESLSRQD
jgi:carbon-monoxide dehydrogenase medium subunit